MTDRIDKDEALALLEAVATEYPVRTNRQCKYLYKGGKPVCIVGAVVLRRFPDKVDLLRKWDDAENEWGEDGIKASDLKTLAEFEVTQVHELMTEEAVQVLQDAQSIADRGDPWSVVARATREKHTETSRPDLLDALIQYEAGTLDSEATLALFSQLVRTGQAWTLQGSYGRTAANMIEAGILDQQGNIL